MNDLTPPPDRPLDDAARARIRAGLVESTAQPGAPTRRGHAWLAPVVAAAAVAAIVGGGTWLLNRDGNSAAPLQPAGSGTSTVAPDSPTPSPSGAPDDDCAEAVQEQLPGAVSRYGIAQATLGGQSSQTSIWTKGDQWVVCDTFASLDGGVPTVFAVHSGMPVPTKDELLISMNFVQVGDELLSQFVAGGLLASDVTSISYDFPDGQLVNAAINGGWWTMNYQPTSGPLAGGGRLPSEPVRVTVTANGATTTYTLEWGQDTCAQINHGC